MPHPLSYLALAVAVGGVTGPLLAASATDPAPLVIGDTFTLHSTVLGETRRINVYRPPGYDQTPTVPVPVLYMPDGGLGEDFLHVAGLVQISVANGTMRPFLLVGIENTERRRDLTGPTEVAEDRKIAPRVGGSAAFRQFLRAELMPLIRTRYRTTEETAIVGESLAGLFVVETLLLAPELFDTYLAFDPSLWWNDERLVKIAAEQLGKLPPGRKSLYLATSREPTLVAPVERLVNQLGKTPRPGFDWHYTPLPGETHGTIYHPAALRAFREAFAPRPATP